MNDNFVIGVDVGGSHICSAVIDIEKGVLCTEPVTTPVDSSANALPVVSAWAGNVLGTMSVFDGEVNRVGFAFPGPFDYDRGISLISGVGKYAGVYGLDVRETLGSFIALKSRRPEMRYVNDASAFALGESLYGAAAGSDRVLAVTLGTGFGSGFVADGELIVDSPDVPAHGWVYHLPFEGGIADDAFSTRWVVKRYFELTGKKVAGAKQVAEVYEQEESARTLFREYGERLASFLAPVLARFGGKTLVIGGNISRAYPYFSAPLNEGLKHLGCDVDVRTSALLDRAAMLGAASLFRK
ncbi:MAG: ROK family protein [Candidatus Cryptobacteroides sp.]|nr:ROK family protein [Bacteroidales bacterium]